MTDYREYTIKISDDGVRSTHGQLVTLAKHSGRARRQEQDEVVVTGANEDVAALLAYLIQRESTRNKGR